MTYKNITNVDIALQNAPLTSIGFGTPLFVSSHAYFPERVRAYSSLVEAAVDLPTESKAYKALQSCFSNTPSPSLVKVGRRDANLSLTVLAGSTEASVTVSVYDDGNLYTISATGSGADEDAVATSLANSIETNTDINSLTTITVTGNIISIQGVSGAIPTIKNLSNTLTDSYTTTETASQVLNAVEAEDADFYFVTADDHTEAFVLAMADAVEATQKMYFFSTYEAGSLVPYVDGSSTDILGKVRNNKYMRTKVEFHQDADIDFPELGYVGVNAGYVAGSVTWTNLVVPVSASKSPITGLNLSITEKGYLEDRNSAYIENRGSSVLRNGRVAGGEAIDVIRGRDNLGYDMERAYERLLLSQAGTKLPYNDEGIVTLQATCVTILDRYVNRGFIEPNYKTSFPRENEVSASDKSNRIYTQGRWEAELTGAIEIVDSIVGILSIDLQ